MIQINQLFITPDNKHLVIDAQIVNSTIFDKVTFDYIAIDTQDTYIKDSISDKAIKITNNVHGEKHIYITQDISIANPMLFVYFVADASHGFNLPSNLTDLPCTWDNNIILEVVCDMNVISNNALGYIKEMSVDCGIPNNFIDYILHYNMLKACLHCGAYNEAIKWWNKITVNKKPSITNKPCGCHG